MRRATDEAATAAMRAAVVSLEARTAAHRAGAARSRAVEEADVQAGLARDQKMTGAGLSVAVSPNLQVPDIYTASPGAARDGSTSFGGAAVVVAVTNSKPARSLAEPAPGGRGAKPLSRAGGAGSQKDLLASKGRSQRKLLPSTPPRVGPP